MHIVRLIGEMVVLSPPGRLVLILKMKENLVICLADHVEFKCSMVGGGKNLYWFMFEVLNPIYLFTHHALFSSID